VWCVIGIIVWTDSWLSIAGAGCGLIGVGACEEQAQKVYVGGPLGMDQISRLGLRDPAASGIKCGPHGGKNNKTKSWTISWLSLKTKVKSGRRGGQVMSGYWWEVTPSPRGFKWFTTKPLGYLAEPQSQDRRLARGCQAKTGLTGLGSRALGRLEAEDTWHDRKCCIGARQACSGCASVWWCYDNKFPKCPSGACIYYYVIGVVSSIGCLHINLEERGW
jgi:hypothetical protein